MYTVLHGACLLTLVWLATTSLQISFRSDAGKRLPCNAQGIQLQMIFFASILANTCPANHLGGY
ncbi:hypothetical protein DFH29DRAFT_955084 [Suillus ampliporus]|nr:hypothetical protein DFH29DRAFT_955084 [Suillus ampliporus]